MAEIRNRELSQFGSFLHIDDTNQSIGITTEETPYVGIGTTNAQQKFHVVGNILCSNDVTANYYYGSGAYLTGISTFVTSNFVDFTVSGIATISTGIISSFSSPSGIITNFSSGISSITQLRVLSGIVTNISGTAATFTNSVSTSSTITNLVGTAATITNIAGTNGTVTNLTGTAATITTFNATSATITNGTIPNGTVTNLTGTAATITTLSGTDASVSNISGSTISYSGLSTFSGIKISSGIITATNSGIVTYYGDGSKLTGISVNVTANADSVPIGTGLTTLNFVNTNGGTTFSSNIVTVDVGKSASGSSGAIQYKSSTGIFSGSSSFTFDVSTNSVSIAGTCSAANFNSTSDINLKENIETVSDALNVVSNLRGVKFNWKETKAPSIGVIAQELEQVLPELVTQSNPKTVNYDGIIGVLIEAIKELKSEIDSLKQNK